MLPDPLSRYGQNCPALEADRSRLQVEKVGDCLGFLTGTYAVRKARFYARFASLIAIVVGFVLVPSTPMGWLAVVCGVFAFFLLPGRLRAARMFEIDGNRNTLRGENAVLPLTGIVSIHGVYTTQGYDPVCLFSAAMRCGEETAFFMLRSTDEKQAEYICYVLGLLLDCPATYTGPFAKKKTCFIPQEKKQGEDFHSLS